MTTRFRPSPTRRAGAPRHSEPKEKLTSRGQARPPRRAAPRPPASAPAAGQIEVEASRFAGAAPTRVAWSEEPGPPLAEDASDHVAVLVRDPQTAFVYWHVAKGSRAQLERLLGARVVAVSPVALRVTNTNSNTSWLEVPPAGARAAYLKLHPGHSYCVELGLTAPSGAFHPLAQAEAVATPWSGPAAQTARQTVDFNEVAGRAVALDPGPGVPAEPVGPADEGTEPAADEVRLQRGGASDLLGPQARRRKPRGGASDAFRR